MFILCDTKYSYFLGKGEKMNIYEKFGVTSNVAIIIISVSVMLFGGFAMTRITKKIKTTKCNSLYYYWNSTRTICIKFSSSKCCNRNGFSF